MSDRLAHDPFCILRARPPFAKSSIVSSLINFGWDHLLIPVSSQFSLTTSSSCALFLSHLYKCITLFFFFLHIACFLSFSSKSVLLTEELQSRLSMFYNLKFQKNIRLKKDFFSLLLSTSRETLQSTHFTSSHFISLCHLIAPLLHSNSTFRIQVLNRSTKLPGYIVRTCTKQVFDHFRPVTPSVRNE